MKFKIVEHTYPIFVLCVIYSLSASFNHHEKRNELQDTALKELNEKLLLLTTNNNINNINYESVEKLTKKNNKNNVHRNAEEKEDGTEKKDTKLVNVDKDGVLSDKNGSTVNEDCHHRNRANEDTIAQQHAQLGKSILKNRELQMEESTKTIGEDDSGNSTETILSFHHEEKIFNSSFCDDVEYTCGNETFLLQQNTTLCFMYNQATMAFGAEIINNPSTPQSKSLCWMLLLMAKSTETVGEDDIGNSTETILSFHHEEKIFNSSFCDDVEYTCGNETFLLQQNTTQCFMYNQATLISGSEIINNPSSRQSKSLCWMLQTNFHLDTPEVFDTVTYFTQRYVLTILHIESYGLFSHDEYPPNTHECEWFGIECKRNNTKIVTGISLSPSKGQIINGTLFQELGSLEYLEKLDLSQSVVWGTIPQTLSNLKSLVKLDLSGNYYINGTMPENLCRQLYKLEYINLSKNRLSGSINEDIGSFSRIRYLSMSGNLLTGSFPLDGFKYNDLEYLDVSDNELGEVDFQLLLNHTKLKYLDLSNNYFRGSLLEHTFISLQELQYFDISQNGFSETIPSTFPELSNITYFDAEGNKFEGIIPLGMSNLSKLKHLNLQGNQLTGSIPPQLNKLRSIETLVLSHNELKGTIPFDRNNLRNIDKLHLHSNKLSGEAPPLSNMSSYITDCGYPSDFLYPLGPISCPTCNICCNSDGLCQYKTSKEVSQVEVTVIFMISVIAFIVLLYSLKDIITSNKYLESFFSQTVACWNALILISDKSVYHFLLIDNKIGWFAAVCCGIFQTYIFLFFVFSADIANELNDREYTTRCPANSLDCEDSYFVGRSGISIFFSILFIWILRDIIGSVKLMLLSFQKKHIDFFFASAVVFFITMLSLWTSLVYIVAVATRSADMVKDAVVLLFVIEIDERVFQLVESLNPDWVDAIEGNMRNSHYEGENLILKSWVEKISTSLSSLRKKMICKRNPVVVEESEDDSGIEDFQSKAVDESSPCKEGSNIVENTS